MAVHCGLQGTKGDRGKHFFNFFKNQNTNNIIYICGIKSIPNNNGSLANSLCYLRIIYFYSESISFDLAK